MGNDFFNDHPMLGSMFDFNRDGSMSLGEAGAMSAIGYIAASKLMSSTEEAERERPHEPGKRKREEHSSDGFGYDSGDGFRQLSGLRKKRKEHSSDSYDYDFDDDYVEYDDARVYEVDTSDVSEVMDAVMNGDFDEADIECLVEEALCDGVKFSCGEAEEILEHIRERDLRRWVESFLD